MRIELLTHGKHRKHTGIGRYLYELKGHLGELAERFDNVLILYLKPYQVHSMNRRNKYTSIKELMHFQFLWK